VFFSPIQGKKFLGHQIFQMLLAKTCFVYCIMLLGVRSTGSNVLMKVRDTLVFCHMFYKAIVEILEIA
jgi:hypothetical protein